ncbi:hypothetical protein VHEMI09790 [[Torrubiella] hemipterigena]|uniref:O-methyltransferase n=1 Tax=[Torrubiella] hemipterigena TaxID=1531966 RepID=A0A0A1TR06_9HYPO|nr:hypothetical protein VHEMI09790 [[Torrubiella] hemipterigena]
MKQNHEGLFTDAETTVKIGTYSDAHSTPLPAHIPAYHASASSHEWAMMLTADSQSKFHLLLAQSIGAKRVLEIGVFLGYSALVWSHAVGQDGQVTGLEYSEEYATIARKACSDNDVSNVDIIVGPAAETLPNLEPEHPYDIVFLDADKAGYVGYLNTLLGRSQPGSAKRMLRPGALIIADNVLQSGGVVKDGESKRPSVAAAQVFNEFCLQEKRLQTVLLPLWDGLTVARVVD